MEAKSEEKKNLGNEEFKKGNYTKAIKLYTEALSKPLVSYALLDLHQSEAIYTNRAASYI